MARNAEVSFVAKICYVPKEFSAEKLELILLANKVIEATRAGGHHQMTLRYVYYRLVSRNVIPNRKNEYDKLSDLLCDARLAGLVDWDAIIDQTRGLEENAHWEHPLDVLKDAQHSFALDKWADQAHYVEVWVEKDAMKSVVGRVCKAWDVPFFSCRGYASISEMHVAALRLHERGAGRGRTAHVLHLGDHDPSGLDMTRDIHHKMRTIFQTDVKIHRIALNMDQIEENHLPPNPAKVTDSRSGRYRAKFGDVSWELDSLEIPVVERILSSNLDHWLDRPKYNELKAKEDRAKHTIQTIRRRWNEVLQLLQRHP